MHTVLAIDTENTTYNKGNAFDGRNTNVCISWASETNNDSTSTTGTTSGVLFAGEDPTHFEGLLRQATTLVFFNAKYDLHWLRRMGYSFAGKRVWCCQVAEFVLGRQLSPYPDLGGTGERYGLGNKISIIQDEYWSKGIQTTDIPRDVLAEYAIRDAELTLQVWGKQQERVKDSQRVLFSLMGQDLLVLQEMEWNGLHFDKELSLKKAKELNAEIQTLLSKLSLFHTVPNFNWSSPQQLSALLYGGEVKETKRVPVGVYKTGKKTNEIRHKIEIVNHHLPRMYKPLRGSEMAKEGIWSVDEDTLNKLKGGNRKLIDGILKIKKMEKLVSTYLEGLPKLQEEMHFQEGYLHGQYHQCVAVTGRLSSSKPNMQNLSGDALNVFISRYT